MKDGFRRAWRAWPMWLMLTAVAAGLAPALSARDILAAADTALGGFPFNLSELAYFRALEPGQLSVLGAALVIWTFLAGGVVDRLARDARSSGMRFFAACGACFAPLVRLTLIAALIYWAILRWIHPWMHDASLGAGETMRMALFGVFSALLFAVSTILDYARVRLVIEDRRSAIGALSASVRLLRAFPGRTLAVQAIFWLALSLWLGVSNLLRYELGIVAIAGVMLLKLSLIAAQTSVYQEKLASAGWVARAEPRWPDEPTAAL